MAELSFLMTCLILFQPYINCYPQQFFFFYQFVLNISRAIKGIFGRVQNSAPQGVNTNIRFILPCFAGKSSLKIYDTCIHRHFEFHLVVCDQHFQTLR